MNVDVEIVVHARYLSTSATSSTLWQASPIATCASARGDVTLLSPSSGTRGHNKVTEVYLSRRMQSM
jgi:hypothetical protein